MCDTARGAVTMRQVRERWLSSPQGEPSGVCTGQRKPVCRLHQILQQGSDRQAHIPHASGSSLRTVVVFNSAKNAPRWMDRK